MLEMAAKTDLRNLTFSQLEEKLDELELSPGRSRQVFSWLSRPGVHSFSQMIDIKKEVRLLLGEKSCISSLAPDQIEKSKDGTVKFCFVLHDGASIESVLIPSEGRYTLCVSSQVGCAMGCAFCLTAKLGLKRNLEPSEIIGQVMAVLEYMVGQGIKRSTPREFINNLVFMGMGEPLANYENLVSALSILMDERGLEFTERRLTVSTCGLVPQIKNLGRDARVNLAISLHGSDNQTRDKLMPINKTYPIETLMQACREYPLAKKKVILIEYMLIKGVNDSITDAKNLAELLQGISCRINLMPFNESSELPFQCSDQASIDQFRTVLRGKGLSAFIRHSRGADISAACGQLAGSRSH